MAFGVLSAPGSERAIQGRGCTWVSWVRGATWRRHTGLWMPEVNTGSWVLGDGTRVARGWGLTSGLNTAAAATAAATTATATTASAATGELGTLFFGLRKLFLSKGAVIGLDP